MQRSPLKPRLALFCTTLLCTALVDATAPVYGDAAAESATRLLDQVKYLASDELDGRGVGTQGSHVDDAVVPCGVVDILGKDTTNELPLPRVVFLDHLLGGGPIDALVAEHPGRALVDRCGDSQAQPEAMVEEPVRAATCS